MSVVMATFVISMIPPRVGLGRSHPGGARHRPERRAAGRPGPRAAHAGRARVRERRLPLPGRRAPGAERRLLRDRARPDDRGRRQHRRGQDDARQPHPAPVRQHRGNRARSAASTCTTSTPTCCGARSASSRSGRTCSPARSRATCSTASPTPPRKRCGRRSRSRRPADFVRNMPGGLNARIEQGGTNVSGGQRQRLSIARALVRKPDIYVFDDSFSALDLATDARLRAALVPYTRDAAVIIVAQRVSTISTADDILVLEDGVGHRARHARRADRGAARRTRRSCSRRSARRARPHDGHPRSEDQDHAEQDNEELDSRGAGDARRGPLELGRCPRRAVEGLQERAAPHDPDARTDAVRARDRPARRGRERHPERVRPARARARHRPHHQRASRTHHMDFGALHHVLFQAVALYAASSLLSIVAAYMLAGVIQRLMFKLRSDVETKVNVAAAELHRQAVARRPPEPGDERHRQRRAEPAADAEPDAHVGAAAHRHRGDDVHDLAAAGGRRAHDGAGRRSGACARSRSGRGRSSSRSGRAPACSTRRSRRRSPVTRW